MHEATKEASPALSRDEVLAEANRWFADRPEKVALLMKGYDVATTDGFDSENLSSFIAHRAYARWQRERLANKRACAGGCSGSCIAKFGRDQVEKCRHTMQPCAYVQNPSIIQLLGRMKVNYGKFYGNRNDD